MRFRDALARALHEWSIGCDEHRGFGPVLELSVHRDQADNLLHGLQADPELVQIVAGAMLDAQNEPGEAIDHSANCLAGTCPVAAELLAFAPPFIAALIGDPA